MNEQAIEKAIEVYLGPDCYTEADVEAVRPHLIEAIAAYLGASGAGRDAEIERLTAEITETASHYENVLEEHEKTIADLRAKLEAAERMMQEAAAALLPDTMDVIKAYNILCRPIKAARGGEA